MITTGAKFYFGLGFVLLIAAVLYGWTSGGVDWDLFPGHMGDMYFQLLGALTLGYRGAVGDHVGYGILLGASAVAVTIGAFMIAFRDSEAKAVAEVAGLAEAPPLRPVRTSNLWAPAAAFAVAVTALGVATTMWFLVAGLALLAVAVLEWAMYAWADRATGDHRVNAVLRNKLMNPIEVPLFGALVAGFVALGISRVFLSVPQVSASWLFIGIAALIFLTAIVVTMVPRASKNVLLGIVVVGAVAVLAAGITGLSVGEREFHDETEELTVEGTGGIGPRVHPTTTVAGAEGEEPGAGEGSGEHDEESGE
jgi:hypothetical protein